MNQPDKAQTINRTRSSSASARMSRLKHLPFLYASILAMLCLALATYLRADTISGTVKDPSGAVIAGAHIEIAGGDLAHAIILTSDDSGKFAAANLSPGKYSVRVTKEGFDDLATTVDLKGTAELPLSLTIAAQ